MVGCIVPWNYPLLLLAWKLAPGARRRQHDRLQAVRADPALDPACCADCFEHLPAGVVNLVAGAGDVGARDRRRRAASTASPSPARSRPASGSPRVCAERIARVNLELGGKDPFIVCADVADARSRSPPAAAPGPRTSTPARSAPRPSASTSRDEVYDDYVERVRRPHREPAARRPARSDTDIGPMVSRRPARRRSIDQLEAAVAAGAEVLAGGGAGGQRRGHFLAPTVVTGAPAETDLLREETFGPVAPIVPVQLARRGDRARQRHPLRPRRQRLHARPARPPSAACASSRPARSGSTTR